LADPAILRQILIESGLSYSQNGRSYIFTCPRCEHKKKLYISKSSGRYICFVCAETENYKGRPEYALADLLGVPVREVQAKLYGVGTIPTEVRLDLQLIDFFGDEDDIDVDAHVIPVTHWPLEYYAISDPKAAKGKEYLASRGITQHLAAYYDLRYSPKDQRVVFPVSDRGSLYGWQARTIRKSTKWFENGRKYEIPKYLSSTGIPRAHTVMFADRLQGSQHAVLCEGPLDAIAAHLCGGNVATMGKAVSSGQMALLLRGGIKKLYLALDPDASDEMQRLMYDHFDNVELYEMKAQGTPGEKADLGAMTLEQVYELFLDARPLRPGHLFFYLDPKVV
jgi:DNA primase